MAKSFGHNAHRLSVEWSRIEPREGEWDSNAIAFYRWVLSALRERGITPLVTLHHFTNPRWLRAQGAWETQAVVPLFERFVERVVRELGDLCDFWVTINEPIIMIMPTYILGDWPPGKKDFGLAMRVLTNVLRAYMPLRIRQYIVFSQTHALAWRTIYCHSIRRIRVRRSID